MTDAPTTKPTLKKGQNTFQQTKLNTATQTERKQPQHKPSGGNKPQHQTPTRPSENGQRGPSDQNTKPKHRQGAKKQQPNKGQQGSPAAPRTGKPHASTPAPTLASSTPISDTPAEQRTDDPTTKTTPHVPANRLSLHRADTRNKRIRTDSIRKTNGKSNLEGLNDVQMSFERRRNHGDAAQQKVQVVLIDKPHPTETKTTMIGLCVKDRYGLRYQTYPTQESLEIIIPHAIEIAITNAPALSELMISTNHPKERYHEKLTGKTRQWLRENQSIIKNRSIMPYDLATALAKLAADGITGPPGVDFHLYTATLTDGQKTYAAAFLWGKNRGKYFVRTMIDTNIVQAEAQMAVWAFRQLPETSICMIYNSSPVMRDTWINPQSMPKEIRPAMTEVMSQIKMKSLQFRQRDDKPVGTINRTVRQMVADLYASQDILPELRYLTSQQKPRKN